MDGHFPKLADIEIKTDKKLFNQFFLEKKPSNLLVDLLKFLEIFRLYTKIKVCLGYTLEYLITVHNGKISYIWLVKKDNFMLINQFKAFTINFAQNQPLKIGLEEIEKL